MGCKIGIISPTRRQGETTVSILLALSCAMSKMGKVLFVPLDNSFKDVTSYTGIEPTDDYTSSITNLHNNVTEFTGVDSANDYVQEMGPASILFSSNERDRVAYDRMLPKILKYLPHEVVIVDITTDLNESVTMELMRQCDLLFVVMSMEMILADKFREWSKDFSKEITDKFFYIINRYDVEVSPIKEFAKKAMIPVNRVRTIEYNPFLIRLTNAGLLHTFDDYVKSEDSRFVGLSTDMQSLINLISINAFIVAKWPQG